MLWSGKSSRTHSQQLMDELTQSYAHFKLAAAHAAGGAAEKMTPAYDRARILAAERAAMTRDRLAPLYEQARHGAMNARKGEVVRRKNRWPALVGLLAAGAAVGAAGAVVARRRRAAAEWDEFEPLGGIDSNYGPSERKSTSGKLSAGAASVAGSVSSGMSAGAGKIKDSLHGRGQKSDMDGVGMSESDMREAMTDPGKRNSKH